jgi:hypothetical protein
MADKLHFLSRLTVWLLVIGSYGCGSAVTATDQDAGAAGSLAAGGSGGGPPGSGGGSAAGGSNAGGSSGSGGTGTGGAGTGGNTGHPDAAVNCTAGTVTFHMTEAPGSDYCVGVQCTIVWVGVKTMSGKIMSLPGGCSIPSCDACMPVFCGAAACAQPQHMKPEGLSLTWGGAYQELATCGAGISCQNKQCAPPGGYIATMCANRSVSDAGVAGFCQADPTPTCVEVPFDYPSTTTVEGVLSK